ncbi:N-acetylneuraminate synthase family protein [Stutzerimonas stutzeri]|uniref:N-acetylneuraminate synthase family protein n=1 Tax=Stutzerimonas stutzeri TaxID=316 RepID=UPI00301487A4
MDKPLRALPGGPDLGVAKAAVRVWMQLHSTTFSPSFDSTAFDLLKDLNVPAYKTASLEVIDLPLIKHVESSGSR